MTRVGTTDNDGKYEFTGLAAGRYRLQVSKAGYVTLEYGQARPFEAGKPLDLAEAQPLDKIDFSLPRGSVIAGRLTDEFGDPIADATVQAMRYQFTNGQRQLVAAGRQAVSDDIGQFRIFGLMPGDYIVRASVRRSRAMLAAAMGTPQGTEEPSGYPTTYFPGTTDVGQAQAVTVALGQELNSVFFSLSPARLARVSGNVDGLSRSRPHRRRGAVAPSERRRRGRRIQRRRCESGARRRRLHAQQRAARRIHAGRSAASARSAKVLARGQLEFASVPLSVSGSDIAGLTIVTTPGVTVSGRVVLQGQKPQATPLRGMQVWASAPSGTQSILGIAGRALGSGRVADDGTFQLRGLAGPQMISRGERAQRMGGEVDHARRPGHHGSALRFQAGRDVDRLDDHADGSAHRAFWHRSR